MLTLKLLSPENDVIGHGRAFSVTRRQQSHGRYWRAPANTPGSESTSSHRSGLCGNEGDPRHRHRKDYRRHHHASLNSERSDMVAWKSEPPVRATTPGNAGRAKGRQFEISVQECMGRTLGRTYP
jgi:hypothetical protein